MRLTLVLTAVFVFCSLTGASEREVVKTVTIDPNTPHLSLLEITDASTPIEVPFGVLKYGKDYRFVLPVKNSSGLDWEIGSVGTGCGCTAGVPVSKRIAAGAESSILISIKPKAIGRFKIAATIKLANKRESDVRLALVGDCLDQFSVKQRRFVVGAENPTLVSDIRSNFTDFDIDGGVEILAADFENISIVGEDRRNRRLVGKLKSSFLNENERQSTTYVSIRTTQGGMNFPIEVVREDVVELRPKMLLFDNAPDSESLVARCFIRCEPDKLDRLKSEQELLGKTKDGTQVEAKLLVVERKGSLAMCKIFADSTALHRLAKKENGLSIAWQIPGLNVAKCHVILNP